MSKKIDLVQIENIVLDPRLQGRVTIDMALVAEYQENRGDLPPVDLYSEETPLGLRYWPGDGWHRIMAHKAAGDFYINARIHEGGFEGALLHACRANTSKTHGAKRTTEDKQRAIEIYMTHGEWYKHSDPRIGKACEVDHKTVTAARERLVKAGLIPDTDERIGLDGKTQSSKKQVGNSQPETQQRLSISTPVESSQRATAMYDEAEAKQARSSPGEASANLNAAAPTQNPPSTIPEGATLHKLLRAGESEQLKRGWPLRIQIPGQKKDHSVTEAITLLPDIEVKVDVAQDNEEGFFAAFTGIKLKNYLCSFFSEPPRSETPKEAPSKSQAKASEGVESSTPSKKNGESYQHYCSPPVLIEATRLIAKIGADFCYNKWSQWGARINVDEAQDSLSFLYPWADMLHEDEIAPLNPPWANMDPFVDKLLKEVLRGKQWLLIGPGGSTSAVWYQRAARSSVLRIEPDKRLKYYKEGVEDPNPRDPSVFFYWGHQVAKVAAIFSRLGWLVTKRVEPGEFAEAAEQLRKEALDARQQGLPGMATPEEKVASEPEIKLKEPGNVPNVRTETPTNFCAWEGSHCPEMALSYSRFCGKHTPPPRLCESLKRVAREYQKEGYEVSIFTPKGTRPYSVMGFLGAIKDRDIEIDGARKDEEEDKYTIDFIEKERATSHKRVVCTLTAVKKAAPKEEPKPDARSPWATRAYAKLKACTTREEFDTEYTKLEALATELEERNDLLEFREELRGSLPSQHNVKPEHLKTKDVPPRETAPKPCPKCHCEPSVAPNLRKVKEGKKWVTCPVCVSKEAPKAPAPARVKGKNEETAKKKNNPAQAIVKKARSR